MHIIEKIFRQFQHNTTSTPEKIKFEVVDLSTDTIRIIVRTSENLSEKQKATIITLAKECQEFEMSTDFIAINIYLSEDFSCNIITVSPIVNGYMLVF